MKVSVSIPTGELRRLFLQSIKGGLLSQRVINEIQNRLLDRIEKDYPEMLKSIYERASRGHQRYLADRLKEQRNNVLRQLDGESYE